MIEFSTQNIQYSISSNNRHINGRSSLSINHYGYEYSILSSDRHITVICSYITIHGITLFRTHTFYHTSSHQQSSKVIYIHLTILHSAKLWINVLHKLNLSYVKLIEISKNTFALYNGCVSNHIIGFFICGFLKDSDHGNQQYNKQPCKPITEQSYPIQRNQMCVVRQNNINVQFKQIKSIDSIRSYICLICAILPFNFCGVPCGSLVRIKTTSTGQTNQLNSADISKYNDRFFFSV
eukprot:718909_1